MNSEIKQRREMIRKGEVPKGYIKNKYGVFPKDWSEKKLSELFIFEGGYSASRDDLGKEGIAYLHYGDIHKSNKNFIDTDKEYDNIPKLKITDVPKKNIIKDGSVIFADASEDYEGIGKCITVYNPNNTPFINGLHTIIGTRKDNKLNSSFCRFFISEWSIKKQIMTFAVGVSVFGISKSNLEKVITFIPEMDEQGKIAEILSTWDKAIELKEKLLEQKKEFKKGLMQLLLFKKLRLSEFKKKEWNKILLNKCLIPTSYPVNKPNKSYHSLGLRSHGKGTLTRFVEDPKTVDMDTLFEVKENELIVNITFAWEGAIAILKKEDEGKLVSHRFPTFKFDKSTADYNYFKHLILTKWFVFQLGLLSPGGAGRNRVLSKKDFLELSILLPQIEEQKKIGTILTTQDEEIEKLSFELEQLKEQKKGLMQLLLTGIVRVKV